MKYYEALAKSASNQQEVFETLVSRTKEGGNFHYKLNGYDISLEVMERQAQEWHLGVDRYRRLIAKYRRLALFPWLPIEPNSDELK